jgi:hypothetical protein
MPVLIARVPTFRRAISAFIILCTFLAVIAIPGAVGSKANVAPGQPGIGAFFDRVNCGDNTPFHDHIPSHEHSSHCSICVNCCSRDVPIERLALITPWAAIGNPLSVETREWFVRRELPPPSHIGWASSWSSQSPPILL